MIIGSPGALEAWLSNHEYYIREGSCWSSPCMPLSFECSFSALRFSSLYSLYSIATWDLLTSHTNYGSSLLEDGGRGFPIPGTLLLPPPLAKHLHTLVSCYFGCQCPTESSPYPYSGAIYLTLSMPPLNPQPQYVVSVLVKPRVFCHLRLQVSVQKVSLHLEFSPFCFFIEWKNPRLRRSWVIFLRLYCRWLS